MFLSHIWKTGQDQCATMKRQLSAMLPGVSVFLDVDDLRSIDALEEEISASAVIMIFVSKGYFLSANCLREVNATLSQEKRSCLVFDPVRGGGPLHDIEAECNSDIRPQVFGLPEAKRDLIAWHRFKDFQLVTLKLIAEQLLLGGPQSGHVKKLHLCVPGEVQRQRLAFTKRVVVYASPNNPRAWAVAKDVASAMDDRIEVTSDETNDAITHFLLYLNEQTYLESGEELAEELRRARAAGSTIKLVMVHENDHERGGCEFGIFFDGRTPQDLHDSGIYDALALALYSSCFWPVSVALVAKAFGATIASGNRLRGSSFTTASALRTGEPRSIVCAAVRACIAAGSSATAGDGERASTSVHSGPLLAVRATLRRPAPHSVISWVPPALPRLEVPEDVRV